jgi:hypothetical protein
MFDGMFLITSLAIYISGEPVQPKTEENTKAEDTTAVSPDEELVRLVCQLESLHHEK